MNTANRRRVVITGMGAFTPLGATLENTWNAILGGRSNVKRITQFDVENCRTQIASYIEHDLAEDLKVRLTQNQIKDMRIADRFVHFSVLAAHEALKHSALLDEENVIARPWRDRTGVSIGTGVGTPRKIAEVTEALLEKNQWPKENREEFLKRLTRLTRKYMAVPITMLPDSNSFIPSMLFQARGITTCDVSACATGAMNIILAATWIRHGYQDVMIAGGADATIDPVSHWTFSFIGATTARNNDPQHASRPFDKERDGFLMGEGGAVLILEELEHALKRGAPIYGEIIGWGAAADASGRTEPEGENAKDWGQSRAMRMALEDAHIATEEVDYINAHGTSTPSGDVNETKSIKAVYGAYAPRIPISSTKSVTGHLLGAAGALETIVCVQALNNDIVPPTINYEHPDPQCDLDYVPNAPRQKTVRIAVNNSFGFGGQNAVLIIKKYP